MKILIYALPRTKSTMLASAIHNGGGQFLYEPFHWDERIRNEALSCQQRKWDGKERGLDYLDRVLVQPVRGFKTLVPHQDLATVERFHAWADLVIYPERDLLQVACSYAVAVVRNKWNLPDANPDAIKAGKMEVDQVIGWARDYQTAKDTITHGNSIVIPWEQSFEETRALLAARGLNIGSPKTQKTRSKSPVEMVSNLGEVEQWLKSF